MYKHWAFIDAILKSARIGKKTLYEAIDKEVEVSKKLVFMWGSPQSRGCDLFLI